MSISLALISLLAFYVAWNLGANDVANSMGTSVGSKAITLRQALFIAGILEFTGAVLFGHEVSKTLATEVVNPALFAQAPQVLLTGMVSVLVACGLWLQVATSKGLPVASSHAVVGAIAGFAWVTVGVGAVDWQTIGLISITWVLTPVVSGAIAAAFYSLVKRWILDQPDPIAQLREWIPWLSTALLTVFGVIVLPTLSQPIHTFLTERLGLTIPAHDIPILGGAIAAVGLTLISWQRLEQEVRSEKRGERKELIQNSRLSSDLSTEPARTGQNSTKASAYSLPGTPHLLLEKQLARFQLLSACFVAFAHGSNDVGNAIAPLAAIAYITRTGSVPLADFTIPLWILVLGGIGIVFGLAIWGKKVIATIGEGIIPLQPSSGFCAELATATTILVASRLGLPASTSHALVGAVVGIGIIQTRSQPTKDSAIRFDTVQQIGLAWLITLPIAAGLAAAIFWITQLIH